jgi:hypothetical protein
VSRRDVAFHEAGHAVAAVLLKVCEVDGVTIRPGEDFAGRNYTRTMPYAWAGPAQRFHHALAVVYYAGAWAGTLRNPTEECIAPGDLFKVAPRFGCARDFEAARETLARAKYRHHGAAQRRAWRAAEAFVRKHWPAVEAVARALVRRTTLDRHTLESIIAEHSTWQPGWMEAEALLCKHGRKGRAK